LRKRGPQQAFAEQRRNWSAAKSHQVMAKKTLDQERFHQ
jgi:hypothetical protein